MCRHVWAVLCGAVDGPALPALAHSQVLVVQATTFSNLNNVVSNPQDLAWMKDMSSYGACCHVFVACCGLFRPPAKRASVTHCKSAAARLVQ